MSTGTRIIVVSKIKIWIFSFKFQKSAIFYIFFFLVTGNLPQLTEENWEDVKMPTYNPEIKMTRNGWVANGTRVELPPPALSRIVTDENDSSIAKDKIRSARKLYQETCPTPGGSDKTSSAGDLPPRDLKQSDEDCTPGIFDYFEAKDDDLYGDDVEVILILYTRKVEFLSFSIWVKRVKNSQINFSSE